MPKKIRVYELAKELGLTNKEGLDLALSLGIGVKSHSSSIEDAQADRVRRKADAEGLRRPVQPEEPAPAKKAAKATNKAVPATASAPGSRDAVEAPAPPSVGVAGEEASSPAVARRAVAASTSSAAGAPSKEAPTRAARRLAAGRSDNRRTRWGASTLAPGEQPPHVAPGVPTLGTRGTLARRVGAAHPGGPDRQAPRRPRSGGPGP